MNALMTISVRVLSAQALAQLRAVEAQSRRAAFGGIGSLNRQAGLGIPILTKYGSQAQWAGRQLTYNFGLPLIAAGTAAATWALENEKAMTRVEKVYGDGSAKMEAWAETEIPALGEAFEALSNQFGVHQKEVIQIAGDWAAAGASGVNLAKIVKTTLETMILGELEAADATKNLIAIQAQYGLSTEQLAKTIEILNMTENTTGTTMGDLMTAMSRSAGTAREAGMSIKELVAITAALVPATGSAATAGNGLRTIISRLLAPTEDAADLLRRMNIQLGEGAWESLNATQRLETLARGYQDLSDKQKGVVATYVASRYQLNRFQTLMRAMVNENSYYNKSLEATANSQDLFNQKQKELRKIMESNPQQLQQQWVILQNAMADVIQPMLPYLVYIAQKLAQMATAFSELDVATQKWIIAGLAGVVAFGLILRLGGALAVLLGYLAWTFHGAAVAVGAVAGVIIGPFVGALRIGGGILAGLVFGIIPGLASAIDKSDGKLAKFAGRFSTLGKVLGMNVLAAPFIFLSKMIVKIQGQWGKFGAYLLRVVFPLLTLRNVLGGIVTVINFVGRAFAPGLAAPFLAALMRMRIFLYVWMATTGTRFRAFIMLMGAHMTLLASYIRSAAATFWAFLVVPGMLSGRLIALWATITRTIVALWAAAQRAMILLHLGAVRIMAAGWVALARVGPIVWASILGAGRVAVAGIVAMFTTLIPMVLSAMTALGTAIVAALTSPIGLAVLAALGIAYYFRDELADMWRDVVDLFTTQSGAIATAFAPLGEFFGRIRDTILDAFWALPAGVRDAMLAVISVVRAAALQVYEWMSYLNPFVKHSPSLVESVTKGFDVIEGQFARAKGMGSIFSNAARHLAAFKKVAASAGHGEFADERKDVKAAMPGSVGLFDALVGDLGKLRPIMAQQEAAVNAQQAVVDKWKARLDKANLALDTQSAKLSKLKARLDEVEAVYASHEQKMQDFASAPIKGMGKFNDRLFENEMAQKRLQLQMMKWEDANGNIEDMSGRLRTLYGDIELLRGRANELRMAGAGSDVLGPIEAQIRAMEAQAKATETAIKNSPVDQMKKEMEELQRQGERMQLEYDVKYDPMTREIEQLANAQKELAFDDIVAGMKREKAAMADLQPTINQLTNAVANQQKVVDAHTAARDKLEARYDREQGQLDRLNEKYQKTADLVREIEGALNDMAGAAAEAKAAADEVGKKGKKPAELSNALQSFDAGANMNFPEVGGKAGIGRLTDRNETDLIAQFTEDANADLALMFGSFDMFAPIRKWWNKTWDWIKTNIGPVVSAVGDTLKKAGSMIGNPFEGVSDSGAGKVFGDIRDTVIDVFGTIRRTGSRLWRLFGGDLRSIGRTFITFFEDIWNKLGPELEKFAPVLADVGKAIKGMWRIAKPILALIGLGFVAAFKLITSIARQVLPPIFDFIIDVIKGFIKVVRGVLQVFVGVFTGNWRMLWEGIKDIVAGIFGPVISLIKNAILVVLGIIEGVVKGIYGFFAWLYDELIGHSIIPDIVNGIVRVFGWLVGLGKWIWNNVLKPIYNRFVDLWAIVKAALRVWWVGIKAVWSGLKTAASWVWDNVLKPVYNRVKALWDNFVKPALSMWWQGIKTAWAILKTVGVWIWENVLKPVFTRVKALWTDHVRPALGDWWNGMKTAWDKLKGLGTWIYDNVMKPVIQAFKDGWTTIKDWFSNNAGIILNPIKSVVRGIVSAINWVIKGLNKLDELPGISISISEITLPEAFAKGGVMQARKVGSGFVAHGARAIVGEGSQAYPEFVIPTDPAHRARAQALVTAASGRLGLQTVPMHADGGILGDIVGAVTDNAVDLGKAAWGKVKDAGKFAVEQTMRPVIATANKMAERIDWSVGEKVAKGAIGVAADWVKGAQKAYAEQYSEEAKANMPSGGDTYVPDPSNPGGRAVWRGGTFSNKFIAHMQKAEQMAGQAVHVMQGGFRPQTSYSGTSHQGDAVDMQVSSALITAFRRVGIAAGDRTGLGNWAPHVHAVPGPGAGYAGGSAVWQFQDYMARGGMNQSHSSPWGLKEGGVIRRKAGGTLFRGGEGGQDEAVIPLPPNWRKDAFSTDSGGGDTIIEINGDLSFPNITNGDDAKTFIENLKVLAKD